MADSIPIRLALALGDQELEQRLRPALDADDELLLAVHCLAADHVVQCVEANEVDAVVLAAGLHRLSESVLAQLEQARMPTVLLVPDIGAAATHSRRGMVLPLEVEPSTLRQAIKAAARGEHWVAPRARGPSQAAAALPPSSTTAPSDLTVLAVAGGAGSPGRTTLAINLATALGAVAPTVLVDLDCASPSVAAYLNRDPSRNVCTLAHAVREAPHAWAPALRQELQPLHPRSPAGVVLCGLPKRELRPTLTAPVLERLMGELTRRYRYVIVDVGAELLGTDPAAITHRAALGLAQHVLVVTAADLVSLWHARTVLGQLDRLLNIERERISLAINRHDVRYHHTANEIEWHLGAAAAVVIPHDYGGVQRAVAEQNPLVLDPRRPAARAILGLAERIHQGRVRLPGVESGRTQRSGWRAVMPAGVAGLLRGGGPS
jgi:Flp pilus assembly CpaE family ATPase